MSVYEKVETRSGSDEDRAEGEHRADRQRRETAQPLADGAAEGSDAARAH